MAMQNDADADDIPIRFCTVIFMLKYLDLMVFLSSSLSSSSSFQFIVQFTFFFLIKIIQDFSEWHGVGIKFSTVDIMLTLQVKNASISKKWNEMKKKSYEILYVYEITKVNELNNKKKI